MFNNLKDKSTAIGRYSAQA